MNFQLSTKGQNTYLSGEHLVGEILPCNTLHEAAAAAGPQSLGRDELMTSALQWLRLATFWGVTAVLLKSPVLRNGPKVEPPRGALPLGPPPPRPANQGRVHQERQRPNTEQAATPHSGLVEVPLPGIARRTSDSTNFNTNFQTAEFMPRTSEELDA